MNRRGNETRPDALELVIGETGLMSGGARTGSTGERALAARHLASSGLQLPVIAALLRVEPATVRAYLAAPACLRCGQPVPSARGRHCRSCVRAARLEQAWPEAAVLQRIRDWHRETGRVPGASQWRAARGDVRPNKWTLERPAWPPESRVRELFGSWSEAQARAGLRPQRRSWKTDELIWWLRGWQAAHPGERLTYEHLRALAASGDAPWPGTLAHRFGSFRAAQVAAGLLVSEPPPRRKLVRYSRALGRGQAPARTGAATPPPA